MTASILQSMEQTNCAFVKSSNKKLKTIATSRPNSSEKPWLKPDGSNRSDAEISLLCRSWNADLWEEYLRSLEGAQKEVLLVNPEKITEISASDAINFLFTLMEFKDRPHFQIAIKTCLKCLSPQQQKIIELYYWENLRFGEIAAKLNLKRQTVAKYHDRALAKLKEMLVSGKVKSLILMADQTVQRL